MAEVFQSISAAYTMLESLVRSVQNIRSAQDFEESRNTCLRDLDSATEALDQWTQAHGYDAIPLEEARPYLEAIQNAFHKSLDVLTLANTESRFDLQLHSATYEELLASTQRFREFVRNTAPSVLLPSSVWSKGRWLIYGKEEAEIAGERITEGVHQLQRKFPPSGRELDGQKRNADADTWLQAHQPPIGTQTPEPRVEQVRNGLETNIQGSWTRGSNNTYGPQSWDAPSSGRLRTNMRNTRVDDHGSAFGPIVVNTH